MTFKFCLLTFILAICQCPLIVYAGAPGVPGSATVIPEVSTNGAHTVTIGAGTGGPSEVYQKKDNGSYVLVSPGALTLTNNAVPPGLASEFYLNPTHLANGVYTYQARRCEGATSCSNFVTSNTVTVVSIPGVPTSIVTPTTNSTGQFPITWGISAGDVDNHQLYRQVNGGSWSLVYSGLGGAHSDGPLSDGTYVYRVHSCVTVNSITKCSDYRTATHPTVVLNDHDGDGVPNVLDHFPNDPTETTDSDGDGVGDNADACPNDATGSVGNIDADQLCDANDPDMDGDGYLNTVDAFPADPLEWADVNNDGWGDNGVSPAVFRTQGVDPLDESANDSEYRGSLTGEFLVNNSGFANYTIPIDGPPGINGMQPNLTLNYSSSRGNGLVGQGWTIEGLSLIRRCRASLVRDGYIDGVNHDDHYKFCLDGQRLVEVAANQYRTESERFVKILAVGTLGSGPQYWQVYRRDGSVLTYGNGGHSTQQEQSRNDAFAWHLHKWEDKFSNYMLFTYENNKATGIFRPSYIEYTKNDSAISTNNKIEFFYSNRPDVTEQYFAGSLKKLDQRLTSIMLTANGSVVNSYELSYQNYGETYFGKAFEDPLKTSRLAKISRCYGSLANCSSPLEFEWESADNSTFAMQEYSGFAGSLFTGDFDGDGRPEFYTPNSDGSLPMRDPVSSIAYQWLIDLGTVSPTVDLFTPMDFNGDGFDDIVQSSVHGRHYYLLSTGSSFVAYDWTPEGVTPPYSMFNFFYDVNADGLLDLLNYNFLQKSLFVALNSSNGFLPRSQWYYGSDLLSFWTVTMGQVNAFYHPARGDFNGDGLIDLYRCAQIATGNLNCTSSVMINTGNAFLAPIPWGGDVYSSSYDRPYLADVNGDGLTDRLSITTNGLEVNLSTGESFAPNQVWSTSLLRNASGDVTHNGILTDKNITFSHFNDDQCADLFFTVRDNNFGGYIQDSRAYIAYSACGKQQDGAGFVGLEEVAYHQVLAHDLLSPNAHLTPIDIDADGFADLIGGLGGPDYTSNDRTAVATGAYWKNKINKHHIVTFSSAQSIYTINYEPITNPSVHNQDTIGTLFDYHNGSDRITSTADENNSRTSTVPTPQYVVNSYTEQSGVAGDIDVTLSYKNYKRHKLGYGSLGFSEIEKTEQYTPTISRKTVSQYSQEVGSTYKLSGYLLKQTSYATDTERGILQRISDTDYRWKVRTFTDDLDANDPSDGYSSLHYFPYLHNQISTYTDLDGSAKYTEATQNYSDGTLTCTPAGVSDPIATGNDGFDSDGNLTYTQTVTCSTEGWTAEATDNIADGVVFDSVKTVNKWVLGLTKKRRQHSWVLDSSGNTLRSGARTTAYGYNNSGQRVSEIREPDAAGGPLWFQTIYGHNNYGTVSSVTESWVSQINDGLNFTSRLTSIDESYTVAGVRTVVITDPEGLTETSVFNATYGLPTTITGIDGITVVTDYDNFARVSTVTQPGSNTVVYYRDCNNCFIQNTSAHYYIRTKTTGKSPSWTYFDALHREVGTRNKSTDGTDIYTNTIYNNFGRVQSQSSPFFGGSTQHLTLYAYDTLDRIVTTTLPDTSTITVDYSGLDVTTTDQLGHNQSQTYNGAKQLVSSKDANLTTVNYNYHPFGDLYTTELNNNADTKVTINYDNWGRKTQLIDPNMGTWSYSYNALGLVSSQTDGKNQLTHYRYDKLGRQIARSNDNGYTHNWIYVGSGNGIGQLDKVTGTDTSGNSFVDDYSYNSVGLLTDTTTTIAGTGYTVSHHYDNFFRRVGTTYPTGYAISNVYNNYGYLTEIEDAATGKKLWQVNERDARGNLKRFTLHGDLVTKQTFDPHFGWIKTINVGNGVIQNHEYTFDSIGNLTARKDHLNTLVQDFCYDNLNRLTAARLGGCDTSSSDFVYDALGNITSKVGVGSYLYQQTGNAGPHAVTQVNGVTYNYDGNGSIITRGAESIDYTTFGKPKRMTGAGNTVDIIYSPDMNRIQRIDTKAGVSETTTYVGGIYEKVESGGVTTHRHYIGDFAVLEANSGVNPWLGGGVYTYLHRDHIGSIVAKTADNSSVFEWLANNPWGQRQASNWSGTILDGSYEPISTARGFTDHEHMDPVGLIHMNGRVYEPILGRFLSPDLFINDPDNSQSFNRYSYVLNNPLSYTDPTGYIEETLVRAQYITFTFSSYGLGSLSLGSLGSTLVSALPGLALLSFSPAIGGCDGDGMCADMLYPIDENGLIVLNKPADDSEEKTETEKQDEAKAGNKEKRATALGATASSSPPDQDPNNGDDKNKKTEVTQSTKRAPKQGKPNSIHEQVDANGKVRSRTFYDSNGRPFSRQDFDHSHRGLKPHEHSRSFDANGRPISKETVKGVPKGYE